MSELNINLSSPEIRKQGLTLKFMMEYNQGEGDYTKERKEMFQKLTVKDIVEDMKKEKFI